MAPKKVQNRPKCAQNKYVQIGPMQAKIGQNSIEMALNEPKSAQISLKMAPNEAVKGQNRPEMGQTGPK